MREPYAYALDAVDKVLRRYYEWLGPDMPSATFDPAYSCEDARRDLHKLIDQIIQP